MSEETHLDHHLWKNGRFYWTAFTVHIEGWRKERIRRSLRTTDRHEARHRRDALFERWRQIGRGELSLRFPGPAKDADR